MLGSETCILAGRVHYDDSNDPVPGTELPVEVHGCYVEPLGVDGPRRSDVIERDRSGTTTRLRVFIPVTSGVTGDTVITEIVGRGGPYRVEGNPQPFIDDEDPELSGYIVTVFAARG